MHHEEQPVNALELLQRVSEMEAIAAMVGPFVGSPDRFRVNVPIKPTNWACKWGMVPFLLLISPQITHYFSSST